MRSPTRSVIPMNSSEKPIAKAQLTLSMSYSCLYRSSVLSFTAILKENSAMKDIIETTRIVMRVILIRLFKACTLIWCEQMSSF